MEAKHGSICRPCSSDMMPTLMLHRCGDSLLVQLGILEKMNT